MSGKYNFPIIAAPQFSDRQDKQQTPWMSGQHNFPITVEYVLGVRAEHVLNKQSRKTININIWEHEIYYTRVRLRYINIKDNLSGFPDMQ